MEFNKNHTKNILKIIFISILFYFFVKELPAVMGAAAYFWRVCRVFVIGGAMAFILNVPMSFIENKLISHCKNIGKAKRPLAFGVTLAAVMLTIYLVMFIVVPQLAQTLQRLIVQMQAVYANLPQTLDRLAGMLNLTEETIKSVQIEWSQISQTVIKAVQGIAAGIISSSTGFISGLVGFVTRFVMALIFCIYILFSKEALAKAAKKLIYAVFKEKYADGIIDIACLSSRTFAGFLSGQCLEAVILGSMFIVAMSIFRMPYAFLVGVLVMVTALIPIVGAFIGCFVGAFLILMENPIQAIWFVVMFLVIQQIEGNLIYPKVVGNSVGLPPILVFAAVIVGGDVFGVVGMLVFIPLTSVCFTLIKAAVEALIAKKNIPPEKLE